MGSIAEALPQNPGLLYDLLHLLSQPLTALHCTLEHSLTRDEAARSNEVALALEQTDRAIEAVRLMREYLEAEEGSFVAEPFPLGLAIENVLEQISVIAEARGLRLFAWGTSTAAVPASAAWLQRALFYIVAALLDGAAPGSAITVVLEDGAAQSLISGHNLPLSPGTDWSASGRPLNLTPDANTLRQVRTEIARRVLELSGASLHLFFDDEPGFLIRLPRLQSPAEQIPA